jgi:chemotaxis protein histidine kinase CheA
MTMDNDLMDGDELQEIIQEFIVECTDLIDSATRDLVGAEKNPSAQAINSLFRAVHTIKGTAGFSASRICQRRTAQRTCSVRRKGGISLEPTISA